MEELLFIFSLFHLCFPHELNNVQCSWKWHELIKHSTWKRGQLTYLKEEPNLVSNNACKSGSQQSTRQRFLKEASHKKVHIRHIPDESHDIKATAIEATHLYTLARRFTSAVSITWFSVLINSNCLRFLIKWKVFLSQLEEVSIMLEDSQDREVSH